jgi:hypothetical protein
MMPEKLTIKSQTDRLSFDDRAKAVEYVKLEILTNTLAYYHAFSLKVESSGCIDITYL